MVKFKPAGLFRRFCAFAFDILLLACFTSRFFLGYFWLQPIIFVAYFAIMESSSWKATLGKRLFSIQVVQEDGDALTMPQAIGRNICKLLSIPALILFAIPMLFSDEKQGLHDLAVDSFVIDTRPRSN